MKKIGMMTYHYDDNYGAVLQCYALKKTIDRLPECKAEIINYIPAKFYYQLRGFNRYERQLLLEKRKKFDWFMKEILQVKSPAISVVNGNEYDYYCVGSDQVWNPCGIYNEEYFLPHVDDSAIKLSYAASIGLPAESPQLDKEMLRRYLPHFNSISVREQEHVALVEELTGKKCTCVLDPTLLLYPDDYDEIICREELRAGEFIFFYWLPNDNNLMRCVELANVLARKYNLPIVHTICRDTENIFSKDGGCMIFEETGNFLWYIKNAKFVVTNSYHGTLFSIQFRTPFYTFVVQSIRARLDTLAEKLDISDRIIETFLPTNRISDEIDFDEIWKAREAERKESLQFLCGALGVNYEDI